MIYAGLNETKKVLSNERPLFWLGVIDDKLSGNLIALTGQYSERHDYKKAVEKKAKGYFVAEVTEFMTFSDYDSLVSKLSSLGFNEIPSEKAILRKWGGDYLEIFKKYA